jgi:hypothetical protein
VEISPELAPSLVQPVIQKTPAVSRFNHILSLVCQINIQAESILATTVVPYYCVLIGG